MKTFTVKTRDGNLHEVPSTPGLSIMQAARDAGIDDILALCGGCLSCATCHVYVEDAGALALGPMSPDEVDLLDASSHRQENSRLSCQLLLTEHVTGLQVTVAPEED